MDLRKGTVIFAIYQRSCGKLIIRQLLAAACAMAGVGQTVRLNGLQSFGFILGLVLLPQNSARALPLMWKEDTALLFTVGSVQDVEYHYFLLLISVLYCWVNLYSQLWRGIRNQTSFWEMKRYYVIVQTKFQKSAFLMSPTLQHSITSFRGLLYDPFWIYYSAVTMYQLRTSSSLFCI